MLRPPGKENPCTTGRAVTVISPGSQRAKPLRRGQRTCWRGRWLDWSSAVIDCRRLACRRAGRCCGRGVPCLERQEEDFARCLVEHQQIRRLIDVAREIEDEEAGYA